MRDADLLAELARYDAEAVCLSVTTLDADLARNLEPRATAPAVVLLSPVSMTRCFTPASRNACSACLADLGPLLDAPRGKLPVLPSLTALDDGEDA